MASGSAPAMQLVDARGEFHADELEVFVTDNFLFQSPVEGAEAVGSAVTDSGDETLVNITILGPRGSGKSTLANRVFGTDFEVGRPFAGKGTKGCSLGIFSSNGLIFDTQGSDGPDADNEKVGRIATFALALSDVLIFNLWASDIGRYEAAGYGLLRTLFTEFSKMYQPSDPTKSLLMFVIRDHDDESSLESMKNVILEDVNGIWTQIDSSESVALSDLFSFEFVSLPHIRHQAAAFDAAVNDLAQRFSNHSHPKYVLLSEFSKNIPAEGLSPYADVVWKDASSDKAVELPGKKELIAAYRCDVAYDAQTRPALAQLNRWQSDVDRGRTIPSYGDKASALLDNALEKYYRDTATHASAAIRVKKRIELQTLLQNRIRSLFNKQILLLQNSALQKFKAILVDNVANAVSDTDIQQALRRVDEWFARKAEGLLVPSMGLSFRAARQEVQNALQTFGEGFRNSPTARLQAMQQMERQAQRAPKRQPSIEFGLGINAACRPGGFGNFQLITGYARGPHTMQFTLVNDKDAAEQEGQGQVPFFRIQPTINTTIDL